MNSIKIIFAGLLVLLLGAIILIALNQNKTPMLGDAHEHSDFKVYLNNEAFDFSQDTYMSKKPGSDEQLSPFVHLHDNIGYIIHKHIQGVTLGEFFNTLNMKFSSTCFILDNDTEYCNDKDNTIKMYVNGKINNKFEKYEFKDLDRILITYGNENESIIKKQIESVTDEACIQSEKCPERGKPNPESSCTTTGKC